MIYSSHWTPSVGLPEGSPAYCLVCAVRLRGHGYCFDCVKDRYNDVIAVDTWLIDGRRAGPATPWGETVSYCNLCARQIASPAILCTQCLHDPYLASAWALTAWVRGQVDVFSKRARKEVQQILRGQRKLRIPEW